MHYISEAAHSLLINSICNSIVPPEFYTLIADWQKREIPIEVVIASIEQFAAARSNPEIEDIPGALRVLVNRNFATWLSAVGRG